MSEHISEHFHLPEDLAAQRLDIAVARCLPQYSRNQIKEWILSGALRCNGSQLKPKDKIKAGDEISLNAYLAIQQEDRAQAIPLHIIFEDDELLVINKPTGLVVHPGAANHEKTLLNALLHHEPKLHYLPRAGIIHRLDKETTGLLVIAKTLSTQTALVQAMQAREIKRSYEAILCGACTGGGTVDAPIDRHPKHRTRMAVVHEGKPAITHYRLMERFREHTHVRVILETGRTHQIRVHMAHIRHPIVGDPLYGGRLRLPPKASPELIEKLRQFKRQALHAAELSLSHPKTGEWMTWQTPRPADMEDLLITLKYDTTKNKEMFSL